MEGVNDGPLDSSQVSSLPHACDLVYGTKLSVFKGSGKPLQVFRVN